MHSWSSIRPEGESRCGSTVRFGGWNGMRTFSSETVHSVSRSLDWRKPEKKTSVVYNLKFSQESQRKQKLQLSYKQREEKSCYSQSSQTWVGLLEIKTETIFGSFYDIFTSDHSQVKTQEGFWEMLLWTLIIVFNIFFTTKSHISFQNRSDWWIEFWRPSVKLQLNHNNCIWTTDKD